MTALYWIDPADPRLPFPAPDHALTDPNGLLAAGGDLRPERLLRAYRHGIFPWYSDDQPILWWSPDPRAVLFPSELRVSRSLRQALRQRGYTITLDRAFDAVVSACAAPRAAASGTWITADMRHAYAQLHALGYAHSVEAWRHGELVGGLYGVALGRVFFGESMFACARDASKVAFACLVEQLVRWDFALIDCQVGSAHLTSLGAREVSRVEFNALLAHHAVTPDRVGQWAFE